MQGHEPVSDAGLLFGSLFIAVAIFGIGILGGQQGPEQMVRVTPSSMTAATTLSSADQKCLEKIPNQSGYSGEEYACKDGCTYYVSMHLGGGVDVKPVSSPATKPGKVFFSDIFNGDHTGTCTEKGLAGSLGNMSNGFRSSQYQNTQAFNVVSGQIAGEPAADWLNSKYGPTTPGSGTDYNAPIERTTLSGSQPPSSPCGALTNPDWACDPRDGLYSKSNMLNPAYAPAPDEPIDDLKGELDSEGKVLEERSNARASPMRSPSPAPGAGVISPDSTTQEDLSDIAALEQTQPEYYKALTQYRASMGLPNPTPAAPSSAQVPLPSEVVSGSTPFSEAKQLFAKGGSAVSSWWSQFSSPNTGQVAEGVSPVPKSWTGYEDCRTEALALRMNENINSLCM